MRRPVARFLLGIVLVAALYFGGAALGGLIRGPIADLPQGEEVEIGLLFGPIHVDFLLPATPETRAALDFMSGTGMAMEDPGVAHFIVGWGARDFYTTAGTYADITFGPTARAVTGDDSVLRVDVAGPISPSAEYPRLRLSPEQYSALLEGISGTYDGAVLPGVHLTPTDGFAEARGRFNILRSCNTWVSRMLRQAGVPMGAWTPTPYSVRLSLWRLE